MNGQILYHGGNLAAARALFPGAPEPWLDLSTGINPQAHPLPPLPPAIWARLPEPGALAALEAVAARRYGLPAGAGIVAAPGTQALIQLLPRLFGWRRVGILGFTYGEYERVWRQAGAAVTIAATPEMLEASDLAVVVNPNNPDGRLLHPQRLAALAAMLASRGGGLVVDEAFMDVMPPGHSLMPLLPMPGVLVLRSFGKAYGLAGVRLGFAAGDAALVAAIRAALGPWAVPGPAIEIGRAALAGDEWLPASRARLIARAAELDGVFTAHGAALTGATPLFRLYAHPQANEIFMHLGRQGILVRHFPAKPEWLRVGIPAEDNAMLRVAGALASLSFAGCVVSMP